MNVFSNNCTIMFIDIAASNELCDTFKDTLTKQKIDDCFDLMVRITQEYCGEIIKATGHEIVCRYESVDYAVQAACAVYKIIHTHHELKIQEMDVRIGLHSGYLFQHKKYILGKTATIAELVANSAKTGQILITDVAIEQLNKQLKNAARVYEVTSCKAKKLKFPIWEIVWQQENDALTYIVSTAPKIANQNLLLELTFNKQVFTIPASSPPFSLGRSQEANIHISTRFVSRIHAFVEYREGKYMLVDNSSNGTYVLFNKTRETVFLYRKGMSLINDSFISLGQPIDARNDNLISFHLKK